MDWSTSKLKEEATTSKVYLERVVQPQTFPLSPFFFCLLCKDVSLSLVKDIAFDNFLLFLPIKDPQSLSFGLISYAFQCYFLFIFF